MAKRTDTKHRFQKLGAEMQQLPSGTRLYAYLDWVNEQLDHPDPLFKKKYLPMIREEQAARGEHAPFLSVITRTQGKRPEMLREVLLCLAAQTDEDFEVLLIGHKLKEGGKSLVTQILGEQPAAFRERIRFIELNEGGRAAPLNVGFALAHGSYVAIMDDDDLAFDDWVESFHREAEQSPGKIVHAQVITQNWRTFATDEGVDALISTGAGRFITPAQLISGSTASAAGSQAVRHRRSARENQNRFIKTLHFQGIPDPDENIIEEMPAAVNLPVTEGTGFRQILQS